MKPIEMVALDLYFANFNYVAELAQLGAGAVTYTVIGNSEEVVEVIDVSGLAANIVQDWAAYETAIQDYFGFDVTLNDQLMACGIETVGVAGFEFAVGGW